MQRADHAHSYRACLGFVSKRDQGDPPSANAVLMQCRSSAMAPNTPLKLVSVDVSKHPSEQPCLHNRWHPDIPPVRHKSSARTAKPHGKRLHCQTAHTLLRRSHP